MRGGTHRILLVICFTVIEKIKISQNVTKFSIEERFDGERPHIAWIGFKFELELHSFWFEKEL